MIFDAGQYVMFVRVTGRNSVSTTLHSARWLQTVHFTFYTWHSSVARSCVRVIISDNNWLCNL